jgi:hypothetical protein
LASLGDYKQALDVLGNADALDDMAVTPDDAAIIFYQYSCVYEMIGDSSMSKCCMDKSATELEKHQAVQGELRSLISRYVGNILDQ